MDIINYIDKKMNSPQGQFLLDERDEIMEFIDSEIDIHGIDSPMCELAVSYLDDWMQKANDFLGLMYFRCKY